MSERFNPKVNRRIGAVHDIIAFIPDQIDPDRDTKFDPRFAGFPFNIMLPHVVRTESGKLLGVATALYEPHPVTFVETAERRELAYINEAGGPYTLKVVLKANGSLEAFKFKGKKAVAGAAGKEFDGAMFQVGLMGIEPDEPVRFIENRRSNTQLTAANASVCGPRTRAVTS